MTLILDTSCRDMTQISKFSRFMAVFMSYSFWVLGRFACLVRSLTCLRDMTRNSSFSRFMAVFMIYCPLFWGSSEIYKDIKTRYMFDSYDQKLVVFVFYVHFDEVFPTVFGFLLDLQRL